MRINWVILKNIYLFETVFIFSLSAIKCSYDMCYTTDQAILQTDLLKDEAFVS